MNQRVLQGKEKALVADHTSTLETVNNLGNLYKTQGKVAEAEKMYQTCQHLRQYLYGRENLG
jgi:Tetratricopeptide repeat